MFAVRTSNVNIYILITLNMITACALQHDNANSK
jgi:hypothetical protein